MKLTLLKLSQDLDLNDGEVTNLIVLQLPNGGQVKAIISEEGAASIIQCRLGSSTVPSASKEVEPPDTTVFGGNDDPYVPPQPATQDVLASRPRPRRVDKDEYGYPVVHMPNGVDPNSLSSSTDADEDGVSQI